MALSDTYMQRPWAPSQDLLQQQDQAGAGVAKYGAEAMEYAHQNRAVTPWQKAIMRLMAGHDPKAVAADTKGAIGSQAGGVMSQGRQGGPIAGGAGASMPQTIGNRYAPPDERVAALRQRDMARDMTGMSAPASVPATQQGGPSDAMFDGMTNRDFGDYTNAMNHMHQQKLNKSQSDLMEIERERTKRALGVANVGGESRKAVANTGADAKRDVADTNATVKDDIDRRRDELKRDELDFKKKKEKDWVDYHNSYLEILRNRQATYDKWAGTKGAQDPAFKALLETFKVESGVYRGVVSQFMNNVTPEGQAIAAKKEADVKAADKALKDYIAKHPNPQQTSTERGSSGQSGQGVKILFPGETVPRLVPANKVDVAKGMGGKVVGQ